MDGQTTYDDSINLITQNKNPVLLFVLLYTF